MRKIVEEIITRVKNNGDGDEIIALLKMHNKMIQKDDKYYYSICYDPSKK